MCQFYKPNSGQGFDLVYSIQKCISLAKSKGLPYIIAILIAMVSFIPKILFLVIMHMVISYNLVFAEEIVCKKCHKDIYNEILKYPFQHSNFINNNCEGCHISGKNISRINVSDKGFLGRGTARWKSMNVLGSNNIKPSKKLKWKIIKFPNYASEHMIVLNNLDVHSTYQVKVKATDMIGRVNESDTISFVPSSISEFWVDDGQIPNISEVNVERIDISVFTSAKIEWITDKLSDLLIEYGKSKEYGFSLYSGLYNKKHAIELNGLDHNSTYHFRVMSSDPFKNKSISGDYTIDTSQPFISTLKPTEELNSGKPEFRMIKILRLEAKKGSKKGFRVAILFSTSKEVIPSIEYFKEVSEGGFVSEEKTHGKWGLKTRREVGIDACVKCHPQGASHPVGISSTINVKIPGTLPTAEGGIMTCATCHTPHGGKLKHLARMDFKRDICILCHTDKI